MSLVGLRMVIMLWTLLTSGSPGSIGSAVRDFFSEERVLHLVAVYGNKRAEDDGEKIGLTNQLFEAALCVSLLLSAGVSLVWLLGISTWSPLGSLACQTGSRLGSGLTWTLLGLALLVENPLSLVSGNGPVRVVQGVMSLLVVLWRRHSQDSIACARLEHSLGAYTDGACRGWGIFWSLRCPWCLD